jgi:hypothetical protein
MAAAPARAWGSDMADAPTYRILALDGGGRWSLITVMALQKIYGPQTRGHDILKQFDLVAANSGGSIILAGLAENLPLDVLFNNFCDETLSRLVFARESFSLTRLAHWITRRLFHIGPKYDTEKKLAGLKTLMPKIGAMKFIDLPGYVAQSTGVTTHFLVAAFDYDWQRAKFFRSDRDSKAASSDATEATVAEAIHASSTAPVDFFNAPAKLPGSVKLGNRFWDGAITGHNNPVLAAVTEVLANQGPIHGHIRVLSIGAGAVSLPVVEARDPTYSSRLMRKPEKATLFRDVAKLSQAILDDPPDSATFEAWVMLGNPVPPPHQQLRAHELRQMTPATLIRLNPLVRPIQNGAQWAPPPGLTPKEFYRLTRINLDAPRAYHVTLLKKFGELWLEGKVENQPIKENHYTMATHIGHDTFQDALSEWHRTQADGARTA